MSRKKEVSERRQVFLAGEAPALAAQAAPGVSEWETDSRLSQYFGWFHTGDQLVIVGAQGEDQAAFDLGLAYGIEHASGRELVLVLPEGQAEPTRRRIPWLDVPVRVFTYLRDGQVVPTHPLEREEILAGYDDEVVTGRHDIGERGAWIERLTEWADEMSELVHVRRSRYLAWYCRGRLVLKVLNTGNGLSVTTGVHSQVPDQGPHEERITGPLGAEQFHRLVSAASTAIADRLDGEDDANVEHRLQERLVEVQDQLGLAESFPEFPARRVGGNRGYIDLLGVGHDGALHVIETKIGPQDPMLVLQGLDYWIWATAHRDEIIKYVDVERRVLTRDLPNPVALDFVVAEKAGEYVSRYASKQAAALSSSIPWEFHRFDGWEGQEPVVVGLGRHRPPVFDRAPG